MTTNDTPIIEDGRAEDEWVDELAHARGHLSDAWDSLEYLLSIDDHPEHRDYLRQEMARVQEVAERLYTTTYSSDRAKWPTIGFERITFGRPDLAEIQARNAEVDPQ